VSGRPAPPGPAVGVAYELITGHAAGQTCPSCRDGWCPAAEWALWLVVADDQLPPGGRDPVTAVARQVYLAHRARPRGGCRPCGLPDCERMEIASAWLLRVGELHEVRTWRLAGTDVLMPVAPDPSGPAR